MMIGIAGGSGSGKTTLAQLLYRKLGNEQCRILAQDSNYIDQSARFDGDGGSVNFDHPSAIDFPLLAEHLKRLRANQSIQVPHYDFATHSRKKETTLLTPARYILVEGILLLSQPLIREQLDASIFVHASEPIRFQRRLERDVKERGRTEEGVRKQFEKQVKPMHDQFVEPSMAFATKIISGEQSIEKSLQEAISLIQSLR